MTSTLSQATWQWPHELMIMYYVKSMMLCPICGAEKGRKIMFSTPTSDFNKDCLLLIRSDLQVSVLNWHEGGWFSVMPHNIIMKIVLSKFFFFFLFSFCSKIYENEKNAPFIVFYMYYNIHRAVKPPRIVCMWPNSAFVGVVGFCPSPHTRTVWDVLH